MLDRLNQYQDWALLILRVVIAAIFVYHGYLKWPVGAGTPAIMMILAIAEPLGGLALLLGVLSRWAALGLSIIMLGAIYTKMTTWGISFAASQATGWEFDLMILAGCIVVLAFGAGAIAIDAKMKR